jgi:SAM-dependent methyltransferase
MTEIAYQTQALLYLDGDYVRNNPTWHAEDSGWKSEQIAKALTTCGVTPSNVCDIGCGAGDVIARLAAMYPAAKFVGYDISEQAYALCKPRETPNCRFALGGMDAADQAAGYDLAMAIDVFEHVEDPYSFLRRMRALAELKLFHIPLDLSALSVAINNLMWSRLNVGHLHYYSRATALALLEECGYEIIHASYTRSFMLPFKNLATGGNMARKLLKVVALGLPRVVLTAISPAANERLLGGLSLLVIAR